MRDAWDRSEHRQCKFALDEANAEVKRLKARLGARAGAQNVATKRELDELRRQVEVHASTAATAERLLGEDRDEMRRFKQSEDARRMLMVTSVLDMRKKQCTWKKWVAFGEAKVGNRLKQERMFEAAVKTMAMSKLYKVFFGWLMAVMEASAASPRPAGDQSSDEDAAGARTAWAASPRSTGSEGEEQRPGGGGGPERTVSHRSGAGSLDLSIGSGGFASPQTVG